MLHKGSKTRSCPTCGGTGKNLRNPNQSCATCSGSGQLSNYFDFPFHYPFNLTITAPGLPSGFAPPVLSVPSSPGNPNQTGVNPALLKLGNENPFEWIWNVVSSQSPYVSGDANEWWQVLLTDVSATTWPFMNAPIIASLFAGDARNPFPQLNPLTFGQQTQLQATGYPLLISGLQAALGVGNGTTTTFTVSLEGPVLPGSVSVLNAGTVVATDADGDGILTGSGGTGTVTYPEDEASVTFTFTVAPVASNKLLVTYTQGCAVINAQLSLAGNYKRVLSSGEQGQAA